MKLNLDRMIRKDLKKWARLCYKGMPTKKAFYKCKLVSCVLNSMYRQGKITKDYFNFLINKLKVLSTMQQYTDYENQFLDHYIEWFENK